MIESLCEKDAMDKIIDESVFKVRKMTLDDLDEVIALESLVFGLCPNMEDYQKSCMCPDNIYMVAEKGSEIIAYCTVKLLYEMSDVCHIAVKEKYRRNHVAQMLLSECISCCAKMGVERILLEVREYNTTAIKFYKKMNFKEIGKRKGYYSNPYADAIVMEKTI